MNQMIRKIGRALIQQERAATPSADDLALINAYAVEPLGEGDVWVRSAMICNDIVDHYDTQFTRRALVQIAELVPGVNLMRNHNEWQSDDLPVGRFFKAEVVDDGGQKWVRGWFYVLRNDDFGDKCERYVAAGIWREVSVSWWMRSFVSSGDGKSMSETEYPPGSTLPNGEKAVGIMDDVVEVNEVSLVARGGQKGTSIRARGDECVEAILAARARRAGGVVSTPDPWASWRKAWGGGAAA